MDDLIRRQDAIDAIRASASKYTGFMEMEMYTDDDAVEAINGIPSAQQWIPCSERLPERQTSVLVTDFDAVEMAYINGEGKWMDYFGDKLKAVTAWRPLPEPWKGEVDG